MKKLNPIREAAKYILILAIPLLIIVLFRNEKKEPVIIRPLANNTVTDIRTPMDYKIRQLLAEDSLCAQYLNGTINALRSDTTITAQVSYFRQHVSAQADSAFHAEWLFSFGSDPDKSSTFHAILAETAGSESTSESVELFFSAIHSGESDPAR